MPKEPQRLRQHTSEEVAAMSSEDFRGVLHNVAEAQRGTAEHVMNRAQEEIGSGIYSHSLEHIGDLPHRINEKGGRFGLEYVKPKVETQHASLTHPYGYEREMGEQMESTKRYRESKGETAVTPERVKQLGTQYAEAHEDLPVYNQPSYLAQGAASSLGRQQFGTTRMYMGALKREVEKGPEHWAKQMSRTGSVEFLKEKEAKGLI